ncbi:MAG TPA: hypothetical protein VF595_03360 [Tepidisphaeraceae bacterium]
MKTFCVLLAMGITLWTALPARAADRAIRTIILPSHDWTDEFGTYVAADNLKRPVVSLRHNAVQVGLPSKNGPRVITLYELDNPPVSKFDFSLSGDVSYTDVDGPAYLELWVEYADGHRSVSRTLDDTGPMMSFRGTSESRYFRLSSPGRAGAVAKHLTLNLVMPGTGTVGLGFPNLNIDVPPTTAPATVPATVPFLTQAMNEAVAADGRTPLPVSLQDLPPSVAAGVRQAMERELIQTLERQRFIADGLADWVREQGAGSRGTAERQAALDNADRTIARLRNALAEPALAAIPPPRDTAATPPAWLSGRWTLGFFGLAGLFMLSLIPLRGLARRGRGRGWVVGGFGLMLATGAAGLFVAGVAMGIGRPPTTWAGLLIAATALIAGAAAALPWVRRAYADVELRKLRAMDMAG